VVQRQAAHHPGRDSVTVNDAGTILVFDRQVTTARPGLPPRLNAAVRIDGSARESRDDQAFS
jgi:hypothetical protein